MNTRFSLLLGAAVLFDAGIRVGTDGRGRSIGSAAAGCAAKHAARRADQRTAGGTRR